MLMVIRKLLRFLLVANWLAGIGVCLVLPVLLLATPESFAAGLQRAFGTDADAVRYTLAAMLLVAIAMLPAVHVIFTRLIAMIDTLRAGHPFAAANVDRLRHIAWSLLAIQLVDLAFGGFAYRLTVLTDQPVGWQLSITGWLSVLLLFVLARVFRDGAAMQDELAGTV